MSLTTVGRLQLRTVNLPAQHGDLVPQYQQFDVHSTAVPGQLGQHLQDLPQVSGAQG